MNHKSVHCDQVDLIELLDPNRAVEPSDEELEHVESCATCQDHLNALAADGEMWSRARQVLKLSSADDERAAATDSAAYQFSFDDQDSPRWTEAMARQLLSPPSHPEMLGRLGRYEVERLLGAGGMGVVFKAFDTELNRPVAIKILSPHLSKSEASRNRFAREARSAAGIVDDHVVPIYNVESQSEFPFLVMQFVAGGSLQQRLDRDGELAVSEILRIGMQTARGLAAAHAQGLVHRDVKPSNVLLDEDVSRAVLTDFGLARAENDEHLTRSGFQAGTPQYMSPEQVRGEAIDERSDLFSLGCMLYALCTGKPPFRSESSYAVLRKITDDTPEPIRSVRQDIPFWLERLILRLLAKQPEGRYQSADEVAELLEACLAHSRNPKTCALPPQLDTTGDTGRRLLNRGWQVAAGFAGCVFLLATITIIIKESGKGITVRGGDDDSSVDIVPTGNGIRIVPTGDDVEIISRRNGKERKVRLKDDRVTVMMDKEGQRLGMIYEAVGEPDFPVDATPPRMTTPEETRRILSGELAADSPQAESSQVTPVAVVFLMHPGELPKGNSIQRHAAAVALAELRQQDYFGYLAYIGGRTKWLLGGDPHLEHVINDAEDPQLQTIMSTIVGDLPEFDTALAMAFEALQASSAAQKKLIVLTDGDPQLEDESILDKYKNAGITIDAIHVEIHDPKYRVLPMKFTESTGGKYFRVQPGKAEQAVPKLFERQVEALINSLGLPVADEKATSKALQKIGVAFHSFYSFRSKLPGSQNFEKDLPALGGVVSRTEYPFSWRVALLPFLGRYDLYDRYRFDEPWDSPANIQLVDRIPEVYTPRRLNSTPVGHTHILGFVTADSALGNKDGENFKSFEDGLSRTLLVVEARKSVPWTQPIDLERPEVRPLVEDALMCLFADGHVVSLQLDSSVDLRSLVSKNDEANQANGDQVRY